MTEHDQQLTLLRNKIDSIDYQIHDLLNLRAKHALEVGRTKIAIDGENAVFFRPEREELVLERIAEYNKGPLNAEAVAEVFQTIMKACRDLQTETFKQ